MLDIATDKTVVEGASLKVQHTAVWWLVCAYVCASLAASQSRCVTTSRWCVRANGRSLQSQEAAVKFTSLTDLLWLGRSWSCRLNYL